MLSLNFILPCLGVALASKCAILPRQSTDEAAYLTSVCSPNITADTNPIPPCIEIQAIQEGCIPNGTSSLDLIAHAECMCNGGFFSNWIGCLNCEYVHGGRSPQLTSAFHTIITSASNQLCTGTPTASFAAIFNSIENSVAPGDATATGLSDQFPSQTAVSLYYTASGPQGLGAITGSATLATRSAGASTSSPSVIVPTGVSTGKTSTVASTRSTSGTVSGAGASSTTSSGGAARITDAAAGGLIALFGAAVVAAL